MPTAGHHPDSDQHAKEQRIVSTALKEGRIGRRDQDEDCRMIEPAQVPFGPRHRPGIVGKGNGKRQHETDAVNPCSRNLAVGTPDRGIEDQHGRTHERQREPDAMHDAIGDQLVFVISPANAVELSHVCAPVSALANARIEQAATQQTATLWAVKLREAL